MQKLSCFTLLMVLLCTLPMAQNARMAGLGNPNMGITNLVDDVSDVMNYPANVVTRTDMIQAMAAATGYVYASKSLMDNMAVGLIFGKPSYLAGSYIPGTAWNNTGYTTYNAALATAYTQVNAYFANAPGVPANAGHLLLGIALSDEMAFGVDIFREAANSSFSSDGSGLTPVAGPVIEEYSKTGAMGTMVGANLGLGGINTKISTGAVMLSHDAKTTTTLGAVTEATLKSDGGMYFPLSAKAKLDMAPHEIVIGVDFAMSNYSFTGTSPVPFVVEPVYSNMHMAVGVGDIIDIGHQIKFIVAMALVRSSTATENTDPGTGAKSTVNTIGTSLPAMSVGIEKSINGFWKIDKLKLRAGGFKSLAWSSSSTEGNATIPDSDNSGTAIPTAFTWTTGLSIVKGAFELEMTVAPARWNGVHFIGSGAGPVGGNITMTYNFGGESGGGGMTTPMEPSYTPPPAPEPEPEPEPTGDDILNF